MAQFQSRAVLISPGPSSPPPPWSSRMYLSVHSYRVRDSSLCSLKIKKYVDISLEGGTEMMPILLSEQNRHRFQTLPVCDLINLISLIGSICVESV